MEPLWADLINSDWRDHLGSGRREDRLGNDRWLARFLKRTGWCGVALPADDERARLRRLRNLLRSMVDTIRAGDGPTQAQREALNQILAAAPVIRRLEQVAGRAGVVLVAANSDIDDVMGTVAASFAHMLAEGEPARIKVCANADCGWVIYDTSRNRSRRWCDKTECGNLINVRRHRRRNRQGEDPPAIE